MAIIKNKLYAFAAIALALIMMFMGSATAKVINVDCTGSGDYTSIQSAINSASNGDTIQVAPCIYRENVVVDKSVSLIGADRNTTIIEGGGSGNVVKVITDNNVISGFTVQNGYCGIILTGNKNTITNNKANSNSECGILLYSSNNTIVNNTALNNGIGIHLKGSPNNTILSNKVSNNEYGIWLYHSPSIDTKIVGNILDSNRYGIYFLDSVNNSLVANNTVSNNDYGIYLASSSNNTIMSNKVLNNRLEGISIDSSSNNTITNNNVVNNPSYGIYLASPSGKNLIYHNNIINNANQALDSGNNSWDNGEVDGGNYWSNWKVKGNPSNGSQPYYISLNDIDHYPFQDPNGWNPKIKIYTDEESYTTGDTMNLGLKVTNPVDAQKVHAKIFLTGPKNYSLIDHKVNLPAGLNYSNPEIKLFTLPNIPTGTYIWNAQLIDPITNKVISSDTVTWSFTATTTKILFSLLEEILTLYLCNI